MARRRTRLPTERVLTALGAAATLVTLAGLIVVASWSPTVRTPSAPVPVPGASRDGSVVPGPTASRSGTVTPVDPFDLDVGDCLEQATGTGELTSVPVVDCAAPHVGEAYAVVRMSGGSQFPGLDAVSAAAEGCQQPFEQFVGRPLAGSSLQVTFLHPTEQSWAAGDREILCVVADPSGRVTGSLRDTAR